MPAAPVRQTSEKYSKRHHRCSSIHAETPEPPSRGGVLRPGLYPDSVRREEVSAPAGKVSALSRRQKWGAGLAPEQGSSGQQAYSVNHRRTTPGMLSLRTRHFFIANPSCRRNARTVRRHAVSATGIGHKDILGSVQGSAPSAAEICYRIRKTKPSRCASSAESYTSSSPSFSYPGNGQRQETEKDADGGIRRILQTFIMSNNFIKNQRGELASPTPKV